MRKNRLLVPPKTRVDLGRHDPGAVFGLDRDGAETAAYRIESELTALQELLYAAKQNSVLVVLQGMDTSGKDGTIKKVMEPVNPLGVRVEAFKVPTPQEAAHDFLWRVHRVAPERGFVAIFNRSHYEDVLVPKVHGDVPPPLLRKRYRHIVDFERILADHGTIVLKFFLHISRDEQERRLLARERKESKSWKLSPSDWTERKFWSAYQEAYEEAISATSTPEAPWYVVPADKKWVRNHLVAVTILDALRPYKKAWLAALEQRGRLSRSRIDEIRLAETNDAAAGA